MSEVFKFSFFLKIIELMEKGVRKRATGFKKVTQLLLDALPFCF